MSLYIDVDCESLNKYNEELCGDKVEVMRNSDSVVILLADGLGSGVKANILATLTTKIIGTMLVNGATIEEAVETIASTLPVCMERGIAYSTFSILQVFNCGDAYVVEFDNPSVFFLRRGKLCGMEKTIKEVNGRTIKESRFSIKPEDTFVIVSDGVVHAGVGSTLNLGWQWDNVAEYIQRTDKQDNTAKCLTKLLLSACDNLYSHKPGDDTTVVTVKVRKPVMLNIMVGPPVDKGMDGYVTDRFFRSEGKKVVCGGTTSQIVSRELGKELVTSLDYFNPAVPPIAEIEGIDLATEGVLTLQKTLEFARMYTSTGNTIHDLLKLNNKDGASRLAKYLLVESTAVRFFVGRAMNPAHQNPDFPLGLSIKLRLVEEIAECLKGLGKQVDVEYY